MIFQFALWFPGMGGYGNRRFRCFRLALFLLLSQPIAGDLKHAHLPVCQHIASLFATLSETGAVLIQDDLILLFNSFAHPLQTTAPAD